MTETPWINADNTSGFIETYEYHCLVRLPHRENKTKGGIIIPDSTAERKLMACRYGCLVAHGVKAFTGDSFSGHKPEIGDVVLFEQYAGAHPILGQDGFYYRTIPDYQIAHKVSPDFQPETNL